MFSLVTALTGKHVQLLLSQNLAGTNEYHLKLKIFRELLSLEVAPTSNSHQVSQNTLQMLCIYAVLLCCTFHCLAV